jgi:hypothetical protein
MWRLSFLSAFPISALVSFFGGFSIHSIRPYDMNPAEHVRSSRQSLNNGWKELGNTKQHIQHIVAPNTKGSKKIFTEDHLFSSVSRTVPLEFTFLEVDNDFDGEEIGKSMIQPIHISSILFSENHPKEVVPRFHRLTPYHYQRFSESVLRDRLSYSKFCVLEEKMADIVFSYLGDTKHHWIIFLDPTFLYLDSIKSYGTSQEIQRTLWVTPSVEVGNPDVVVLEEVEDGKKLFI